MLAEALWLSVRLLCTVVNLPGFPVWFSCVVFARGFRTGLINPKGSRGHVSDQFYSPKSSWRSSTKLKATTTAEPRIPAKKITMRTCMKKATTAIQEL
jgi:hypothetical protein